MAQIVLRLLGSNAHRKKEGFPKKIEFSMILRYIFAIFPSRPFKPFSKCLYILKANLGCFIQMSPASAIRTIRAGLRQRSCSDWADCGQSRVV